MSSEALHRFNIIGQVIGQYRLRANRSNVLLGALALLLTAAIFTFDILTPHEIAASAFYVLVVLISLRFLHARGVVLVAFGCVGLSILSFLSNEFLSPRGSNVFLSPRGTEEAGIVNLAVSIVAVLATAYLATALRESEALRALALEAADIGAWDYKPLRDEIVFDLRGRALLSLQAGGPPVGYSAFLALVHPADRAQVDADVRRALDPAGPGRYSTEYRAAHAPDAGPDAGDVWIAAEGRVEFENGRAVRARGVVRDTSERKRAELHRELLVNELNHRVKNSLATVQALALKTLRAEADPVEARASFTARIIALARAHDVLTRRNWENAELAELVAVALAPHRETEPGRVRLKGPRLWLSPKAALALYMAVYELGGNAVKYGALSDDGTVEVRWTTDDGRLHLTWREQGGPMVVPPSRKGLGTSLLEQGLAGELDAEVRLDYRPEGLLCTVDAPLSRLVAR
jgi:two-component sensor histidine kinase